MWSRQAIYTKLRYDIVFSAPLHQARHHFSPEDIGKSFGLSFNKPAIFHKITLVSNLSHFLCKNIYTTLIQGISIIPISTRKHITGSILSAVSLRSIQCLPFVLAFYCGAVPFAHTNNLLPICPLSFWLVPPHLIHHSTYLGVGLCCV